MKLTLYSAAAILVFGAAALSTSVLLHTVRAETPTPSPSKSVKQDIPLPEGPINLTMSPTFVNLVADPGKQVSSQFTITNKNAFTEYFKLSLVRYEVTDAGRGLTIVDLPKDDPFPSWVTLPEKEFRVDANQVKTVRFSITPPKDATLGYYYGILVARARENLPSGQTAVSASPVFSVILEINTPNAKRELQFLDFSTDAFIYEYLPTTFNISVKNTGNIHIVPTGNVFIDSTGDKDVAILSANPGRGNVLPKSYRTFTTSWDDAMVTRVPKMADGRQVLDKNNKIVYTTKFDIDKPLSKFRIGKYTAHLLMVYDNGQRDIPLEARLTFWVLPWKMMLGAAVIAILALMGLRSTLVGFFRRVRGRK